MNKINILWADDEIDLLKPHILFLKEKGYEVDVNPEDKILNQEEIINYLSKKDYDGVISLLTDILDKNVFEKTKSVKIFVNYATGFDNINLEYCVVLVHFFIIFNKKGKE